MSEKIQFSAFIAPSHPIYDGPKLLAAFKRAGWHVVATDTMADFVYTKPRDIATSILLAEYKCCSCFPAFSGASLELGTCLTKSMTGARALLGY